MRVRIYKPSRSTMQSGRASTRDWVLTYELKSSRRPDPLMGWTSADDTLNQVCLHFDTLEKAVTFAQKKGFEYTVQEPHQRIIPPKNYLDNFKDKGQ